MSNLWYGNVGIDLTGGHGGRVVRRSPTAAPASRGRRARAAASPVFTPHGREWEIQDAVRAIVEQRAVELVAACGYGKSTLLRYLAGHASTHLGRPGVYLIAGDDQPGDVLQRLVDKVFPVDRPDKITPVGGSRLLNQARAVICLDDVACTTQQLAWLLQALPGCSVVLGSDRPRLGRYGHSIVLAGLPDAAAMSLITDDLGRPLTEAERAPAAQLVTAVHGQPLRLRQAAALVRAGEQSFAALASRVQGNPPALDQLSVAGLSGMDRRLLATLALLGGVLLPADLISVVSGVNDVVSAIGDLRKRALVDHRDDRFGLPACRAESYHAQALSYLDVGQAAREIATWMTTRDPGSDATISAASAALSLIGFAAERRDWKTVALLVRVVEPVLTLAGRWETCRHILEMGAHAAQAIGDKASEALFLHQQGTLAVCQQRPQEAQHCLSRAAHLRQEIGDDVGADLSRYNLSQLTPPQIPPLAPSEPPPPQPPPHLNLQRVVVIAGIVLGILAVTVTGVAALNRQPPTTPLAGRPSTTTSTTAGPQPTTRATSPTTSHGGSTSTRPTSRTSTTKAPALRPPVVQPGRHAFLRLNVSPGHPGVTHVFTLTNPNDRPLAMKPAVISGDPAFKVSQDGCAGTRGPGSCEVTVAFDPTTIGDHAGTLMVGSPAGSASATLTGTGFAILTVRIVDTKGNERGLGTVTDSNGLINCPQACRAKIQDSGQRHTTLTEKPLPFNPDGSRFVQWQGPCSGTTATCDFDLGQDTDVTAVFDFVVG
jgi:hypothetical protein